MASSTAISIIIPVKNAGNEFRETLAAIFAQQDAPSFEVIVIDSGSTDGTLELCQTYPIKTVSIPPSEFGHGRTRNLGASLARGEYLVFTVQDALPSDTRWLSNLVEPLQDPKIAGSYSRNLPRPGAGGRQSSEMALHFPARERLQTTPSDHFFSDVSSAMRKSIWEQFPYDEVPFGEDQLWAAKVLQAGYQIKYQASSCVIHSHDDGMGNAFRRGILEGALARSQGRKPAHSSRLVVCAEALYETLKWLLRGDLKSCRYSLAMAAWHFGFIKGWGARIV